MNTTKTIQLTIDKDLKNLKKNSNLKSIDFSKMISKINDLADTQKLEVTLENDFIDTGIIPIQNIQNFLNDHIILLEKVNPVDDSKKKTKKAKKAIQRLKSTLNNLNNGNINWFMYPASKHPRPVSKSAVRNFLVELHEMLGASLLPSEQLAIQSQKEFAKGNQ